MMKFRITDSEGLQLDSNVLLEPQAIILLSRGGTAGSDGSQNQDYPTALRLILHRLLTRGRGITGAWVDSRPSQALPLADRQIHFPEDAGADAKSLFSRFSKRMEGIAKMPNAIPNKGNRNKRLRIEVATESVAELAGVIGAVAGAEVPQSVLLLPPSSLRKVTHLDIWVAIDQLGAGGDDRVSDEQLEYGLLTPTGVRSPDVVFALAASEALGFTVRSINFSSGVGSLCFQMLEEAGWPISNKGAPSPLLDAPYLDDREWIEGDQRRLSHLRRERHPGVVRAKKAQMRISHGRLFCEECGLDPIDQFGDDGEACIEVHHNDTEVARMASGHITRLADVECLCANCHRIRHKRMKAEAAPNQNQI